MAPLEDEMIEVEAKFLNLIEMVGTSPLTTLADCVPIQFILYESAAGDGE